MLAMVDLLNLHRKFDRLELVLFALVEQEWEIFVGIGYDEVRGSSGDQLLRQLLQLFDGCLGLLLEDHVAADQTELLIVVHSLLGSLETQPFVLVGQF